MMELQKMINELQSIYDRVEFIIDVLNDVIQTALEKKEKVIVHYAGNQEIEIVSFYVINWACCFGTEEGLKMLEVFEIENILIG